MNTTLTRRRACCQKRVLRWCFRGGEEFRWIGRGPYAGYPGKERLSDFGLWHLNHEDLYFRGE